MPNWCLNEVSITGKKEDILKIAELFGCMNNEFSFDSFMPIPDPVRGVHHGFTTTEDGTQHQYWREKQDENKDRQVIPLTIEEIEENQRLYGAVDWYEWCNKYWGTKWDASMCGDVFVHADDGYDYASIECSFETAWGPPEGVYNKLVSMFPEVDVDWFYKEPGMRFAGWLGAD